MIQYVIVGSPSKFTLMVCFFDKVEGKRRPVTFEVFDKPENTKIDVVINEITWEDGSGESWCFKGYITERPDGLSWAKVDGYFRTTTREGWIKIYTA